MLHVFLDANVLFSAAWRERAGLLALWERPGIRLISSGYAVEEARRNLETPERRSRLVTLLASVDVVPEAPFRSLPPGVQLPEKDLPILRAALAAGATHLLTGDLRDFGHLMGRRVAGLQVQAPGDFLRSGRGSRNS